MEKQEIDVYLDILASEYKKLLRQNIVNNMDLSDDSRFNKLLEVDNKVKRIIIQSKQERRNKLFQLISLTYVLLAVMMIMLLLIKDNRILEIDSSYMLAIVFIVLGIYIYLLSNMIKIFLNLRKSSRQSSIRGERLEWVLNDYIRLENVVKYYVPKYLKYSLPKSLEIMENIDLMTSDEYKTLLDFVSLRNSLVHFSDDRDGFNLFKERKLLNQVNLVIDRLEKGMKINA